MRKNELEPYIISYDVIYMQWSIIFYIIYTQLQFKTYEQKFSCFSVFKTVHHCFKKLKPLSYSIILL